MSGDVVRDETRALAAELAEAPRPRPMLAGPPPRVASNQPAPASGIEQPVSEPPYIATPAADNPTSPSAAASGKGRRARSSARSAPSDTTTSVGAAAPVTITLTRTAGDLLEGARSDETTVREVLLAAVQASVDELRRQHPPRSEPAGPIPIVRVARRRKLEGYGVKVPVRLYRPEKEALDALADELGLSVSAMVTEALELRYGRRGEPVG